MPETKRPRPEELVAQIAAYEVERPRYQTYADALKRVLKAACRTHLGEAIVTARAKDVSSFAEKCVRKADKYPDPVHQFTDLCGGRVIVQTLSQVEDVRRFVERNFIVVETEDISLRLGDQEFGYRDRHYIVQLDPQRAEVIGFAPEECPAIGERKAELQIRTLAQHAWADTLHDRTYKSPLHPTTDTLRATALLAALMEEGDRNFDQLANELDRLVDNYAAHHDRKKVQEEIELHERIHQHQQPEDQPPLALRLAKLHAVLGEHEKVIQLLAPQENSPGRLRHEIRLELGTALCRQHRHEPGSTPYLRGHALIAGVADDFASANDVVVLNSRRRASLRARALSRRGWACEAVEAMTAEASQCHRQAHELEPANPYYLANMLGFEIHGGANVEDVVRCLRPTMLGAVSACASHAAQGMELPFAFFTAGRLRLLLGEFDAALPDYLRGAHHCLDEQSCVGCGLLDDEVAWLHRIWPRRDLPLGFQIVKDLLRLAKLARNCQGGGGAGQPNLPAARAQIAAPVLIVAGGAATLAASTLDRLREPLTAALRNFRGTVISGGTKSGVPGLVGEVAATLKNSGGRHFTLIGYRPRWLPEDAPGDERYDQSIAVGESRFTAEQILANWTDILAAGISPKEVRLLGIGGGPVAAVEYRMALAMRARVGLLQGSEPPAVPPDAAAALLADPQWRGFPNLLPLPFDAATLRAFLNHHPGGLPPEMVEQMARALHRGYLDGNKGKLPENLRPWDQLPDTYRQASLAQAAYAVEILRAAGFEVRPATGASDAIKSFEAAEFKADVEGMAELEHGRWNVERLGAGWRPGKVRDNERKLQPCLVPWSEGAVLTEGIKDFDRQAVRAFPQLLALAGLEICRRRRTAEPLVPPGPPGP
jgi:ppGpp synthetase/RelA/SpoT-type nucleotidyltranferase